MKTNECNNDETLLLKKFDIIKYIRYKDRFN